MLSANAPRRPGHVVADVDDLWRRDRIGGRRGLLLFVPDRSDIVGLNYHLMMGSAMIPAVAICAMVQLTPGSPRWYLAKNCHREAYLSSCQLRYKKVQAARDLFHMDTLLQAEKEAVTIGQSKIKEILTMGRNRNAMLNSEVGMFMQQYSCFLTLPECTYS